MIQCPCALITIKTFPGGSWGATARARGEPAPFVPSPLAPLMDVGDVVILFATFRTSHVITIM